MSNEFQNHLPPISEIWVYLSGSPLLALVLTLSAYLLGLTLYERSQRNPPVSYTHLTLPTKRIV